MLHSHDANQRTRSSIIMEEEKKEHTWKFQGYIRLGQAQAMIASLSYTSLLTTTIKSIKEN